MSSTQILIAEDDDLLRPLLEAILRNNGFEVECVEDGTAAVAALLKKDYHLLITDVKMPKMDGIALLQWSKKERPKLPILVMTGFADVLDTIMAHRLGAAGFITKPFQKNDVIQAAKKALTSLPANESTDEKHAAPSSNSGRDLDENYCQVPIDEFVAGKVLPFAIYIRLNETKYVKIAHEGEAIDIRQVKAYKEKGVKHLFLTREDFYKYLNQNLAVAKALSNASNITPERKMRFMKHTGEVLMSCVMTEGVDRERFSAAKNFVMAVMDNISSREDLLTLLEMLNSHSDTLFAHSLGVGLYAVMMCQQLGWKANPTTYTVQLAGLFHDIGKKEVDQDLLNMKRISLNQKQRVLIETHTIRGSEIMSSVSNIPEEIAQVPLQHHEDLLGYGYPNHLTKGSISSLSRMIAVANVFCEYAIKNPDHPDGMPALDAIIQMERFKKDRLDGVFLSALKDAVQAMR